MSQLYGGVKESVPPSPEPPCLQNPKMEFLSAVNIKVVSFSPTYLMPPKSKEDPFFQARESKGSGWIFHVDKKKKEESLRMTIVTCAHVLNQCRPENVLVYHHKTGDEPIHDKPARLLSICPDLDIAVLSLVVKDDAKEFLSNVPALKIFDDHHLRKETKLTVHGYPQESYELKTVQGSFSGLQNSLLQMNVDVYPGNSGGPVCVQLKDGTSAAVGIVIARDSREPTVGLASPAHVFLRKYNFYDHLMPPAPPAPLQQIFFRPAFHVKYNPVQDGVVVSAPGDCFPGLQIEDVIYRMRYALASSADSSIIEEYVVVNLNSSGRGAPRIIESGKTESRPLFAEESSFTLAELLCQAATSREVTLFVKRQGVILPAITGRADATVSGVARRSMWPLEPWRTLSILGMVFGELTYSMQDDHPQFNIAVRQCVEAGTEYEPCVVVLCVLPQVGMQKSHSDAHVRVGSVLRAVNVDGHGKQDIRTLEELRTCLQELPSADATMALHFKNAVGEAIAYDAVRDAMQREDVLQKQDLYLPDEDIYQAWKAKLPLALTAPENK